MSAHQLTPPPRRPGVILLIVVVLLALFAVVGISFMLYAESAATASRIYRESMVSAVDLADEDESLLLNWALAQLIYDVRDFGDDVYSGMRGWSLARNMYGWNYNLVGANYDPNSNNNTIAFNGNGPRDASGQYDQRVNFTFFPQGGSLRDPERSGPRAGPAAPLQPFFGGFNVPYTYPDRANMFLGALRADDNGTPRVLMPSFFRPDSQFGSLDPSNPNWLSSDPRYREMVLRPRPVDMYWGGPADPHSFPLPADAGGDVKNLPGILGYNNGNNDSFWMDLNYPVLTTRAGRKFKPLFAFLILDLDNRLNVNVHGNLHGVDATTGQPTNASNQGLGAHEVNLSSALAGLSANAQMELLQLFRGSATAANGGRYGSDQQPGSPSINSYPRPTPGSRGSYLSRLDFDATNETTGYRPTTRFTLPGQYQSFPSFVDAATRAPTGYDNQHADEPIGTTTLPGLLNHPLLYNKLRPFGDQTFGVDNLFWMLGSATGTNHQRAALYKLMPTLLDQPRARFLLTTHSYDLDTPGASPQVVSTPYQLQPNLPPSQSYPNYNIPTTYTSPTANSPGTAIPNDGRAAVLPRIDLNRKLTPYYRADGRFDQTLAAQAIQDRQGFARDVFDRFVLATGARPLTGNQPPAFGTPEYNALRYLAQLAVNIVDYIDDDDIMTPFPWDLNSAANTSDPSKGYVFGTEAPKVVLNEAYAEMRNAHNDNNAMTGATQDFRVNFWVELYNPHPLAGGPPDPNIPGGTTDRAAALLQYQNPISGQSVPVYRIEFVDERATTTNLRKEDNVDGLAPPKPGLEVVDFTGPGPMGEETKFILPGGGKQQTTGGNDGFYVVGPRPEMGQMGDFESGQTISTTLQVDSLTYTVPKVETLPPDSQPTYTVLLRRLACPYLPPNTTAVGTPNYNPYITVDYLTGLKVADIVQYGVNPLPNILAMQPAQLRPQHAQTERKAHGRLHPYSSIPLETAATDGPRSEQTSRTGETKPAHTFFQQNSKAPNTGFEWLVHLDRQLISPAELLHVSGFKPHELTQQFTTDANSNPPRFQHLHRAPWLDVNARIYRALEYLAVGDRSFLASAQPQATSAGGRRAGLININTVWDRAVFNALCDAKPAGSPTNPNFFDQSHVDIAWNSLLSRRSTALGGSGAAGTDKPIQGLAMPLQQTEFMTNSLYSTFKGALNPQHPYVFGELLTKISGNVTTRSNVFAVYLTVGFFEVMDETARPVKLGAEIRARSGLPIRHKMFAIVDRTNLALDFKDPLNPSDTAYRLRQAGGPSNGRQLVPFFLTSETAVPQSGRPSSVTLKIAGGIPTHYEGRQVVTSNSRHGRRLNGIIAGESELFVDFGVRQVPQPGMQPVTVTAVDHTNGTITVSFPNGSAGHAAGFTLCNVQLGNPGPQTNFDFNEPRYQSVVPFTQIVQ